MNNNSVATKPTELVRIDLLESPLVTDLPAGLGAFRLGAADGNSGTSGGCA
jgi:hypothetical protein